MLLLADESTELDEGLLAAIGGLASGGKLAEENLRDFLRLFCMVCNRVDELRFELGDFTQSYQFEIGGRRCAAVFRKGACEVYSGDIDSPDITMNIELGTILELLMGRLNSGAAHMNGDIRYRGTKNGAVKLQAIFELFLDELDARERPARSASE
jgi:putative sterol carrier protein